MSDLCQPLQWDSQFFGRRIARAIPTTVTDAELADIRQWCADTATDCLYFLADDDPALSRRLARAGFDFVDTRLTFEFTFPPGWQPPTPSTPIVPFTDSHLAPLQAIARHSYRLTRFYADPHFSEADCDRLYETWVTRSVQGYADATLVALVAAHPAAFITCSISDAVGYIGLVGVAEAHRGLGLGHQIVMAGLNWFYAHACSRVEVVTQGRNIAAQRLYQRCGFLTRSAQLWYHYWP